MLLGHTHTLLTQTCSALNYNMKRQVQPVLCAGLLRSSSGAQTRLTASQSRTSRSFGWL